MTYWAAVVRSELLRQLASHDAVSAETITIEIPTADRRTEFDVRVASPRSPALKVLPCPTDDEVLAWLQRSADEPRGEHYIVVHDEDTSTTQALRAWAEAASSSARSADDALISTLSRELGSDAAGFERRFRLCHRPGQWEERFAHTVALHVCQDSAYADVLLDRLGKAAAALEGLGGRVALGDLRRELHAEGIALEPSRELEADLQADVLRRADGTCCVCRRPDVQARVHLINELPADHDPDNLAAVCGSCWATSRRSAAASPAFEFAQLSRHRRDWDWEVAQTRRNASVAGRPRSEIANLHEVLRRHLREDFHWDGPRRGEFARLGGRMEDRFYQPHRGERLTARPAYYHTYWGLVGSKILLPDLFASQAEAAAVAVADRLSQTGWIGVDLEDYAAPPPLGRRRVQTIRHTARAAMILLVAERHLDLAAEVAWNVLTEAESSLKHDGGWGEFRNEPEASSTLYSSMYAQQLLSSVCLDPSWERIVPELPSFKATATGALARTWRYLAHRWHADRWSMSGMPWIVNSAAIVADLGIYMPAPLAADVHRALRDALNPIGRLIEPHVGADWDAPEPVLAVRVAFAAAQLACATDDERLARLRRRLLSMTWADVPLRTMDVGFLSVLSTRVEQGGRVPVEFDETDLDRLAKLPEQGPEKAAPTVRVFISYVREDVAEVSRLADELRARGIEVWLDRDSLQVGVRWKDAIRQAIREGDYFLAVFSPAYMQRRQTYMNEELLVAVEELRLRPRHRRWFLPVTLGAHVVPDAPIGPGETLNDLQQVSLIDDWDTAVARLAAAMTPPS
ncbi:toll/interleukin-1 receptor domain-containing protein [Micromonospora noduli]|uniref:toll/interleukin-1 receptor domain-containing protein n=1 Tax=Micromonospora noduli TaxID=709876 RepID=UPI001788CDF7|nr:toll/interleukin-1 receptor domain-containing protein [Micromonospora noduli]